MNAIEIRGLKKSFRGLYALDGLNMTVPQGAIYGFIGENGSGKSTTEKLICGLLPFGGSSVKLYGRDYTDEAVRAKKGDYVTSKTLAGFIGGARQYLVFNKEQNGGGALFSAIEGLYSSKGGAGGELEALACSFHILYELYISCGADPVGSGADDYNLQALRRMIAFICSNYGDKIQLNDIARAGSICKSKCNGIFKQYLNTTPVNYLIDYRIQKAMELLSCTDMKITDVCFETGFLSVSYFIETFKRSYGYPPSHVRKAGLS